MLWWACRSVQDVDGVLQGVRPETRGRVARDEVGSQHFHNGADGALCHAVQLVHMRRASGVVYEFIVHELRELLREELASVVGVHAAYSSFPAPLQYL